MSARVSSAAHLDNSPPKKKAKKSKQHATRDEDLHSFQHMQPNTNSSQVNGSLEAPRCSGRAGAGSGGRIVQLEKIGDVLDGQTKQPRTSRMGDLPNGTAENPLAPPKRGRCSVAKNVSFVTAETLMLTLPKCRGGAPPPYTAPSADVVPTPPVSVSYNTRELALHFISPDLRK